jgi:hypothetical protein
VVITIEPPEKVAVEVSAQVTHGYSMSMTRDRYPPHESLCKEASA